MTRLLMAALVAALVGFVGTARAEKKEDKKADPKDPTGTWKWTVDRNGQTIDVSLKLAVDKDGKLTGSMPGRQGSETKIDDGKFDKEKGEISFSVTRDRNGTKTTTKYTGKLNSEGTAIEGKYTRGEDKEQDWKAKRAEDKPTDKTSETDKKDK